MIQDNIIIEDYMEVFDKSTGADSKELDHEEMQDICDYWMNLSDEKFLKKESNLLDWAAAF